MIAEALREAQRRTSTSRFEEFQHQYRYKPAAFVHDLVSFDGLSQDGPTKYQDEILQLIPDEKRVAVRGPHGVGKSCLSAWVVLWAVLTADDCKVPTTASAWRQLTKYLWPEIHKWAPRLNWAAIGREPFNSNELMKRSLSRLPTCEAFAVASNNSAYIEGAHAQRICYVYDEAKAIPNETWDASEGAFAGAGEDTTAEGYALAISTPGAPMGRFYDIHKRKRGTEDWHAYHITLEMGIKAGMISRQWATQRAKLWGVDSPLYQNRVLGEFAKSGDDVAIPLAWVEAANERWHEWVEQGRPDPQGERVLGVDIARYGDDNSCIAERIGNVVTELEKWGKEGLMATTGRIKNRLGRDRAQIDLIGMGAGVYDRLVEQGCDVVPIDFREKSDWTDISGEVEMYNLRAAAWWSLREGLDPDTKGEPILLPPDDELTGDLTTPKYGYMSSGKLKIESKEDIKKRLGHSPDTGDSVVISFWEDEGGWSWFAG